MVDDEPGNPTQPYAPAKADLPTEPAFETQQDELRPLLPTHSLPSSSLIPGGTAPALTLPEPGYKISRVIGRGGMGEVFAARDARIGREIAIKRMKNPQPSEEALARFLREARIQAQLDHPAIVPVHELGLDDQGRPYFTMKRCSGTTLSRLLASGGSMQKLLRAFVDVCLAIDFAHARGVVHRDLKPANILIGDYGEVYVLDWGVARVLAEPVDEAAAREEIANATPDPEHSTRSGALLGTPGYIPPEQIQGAPAAPAADVYALGCILFEILACEPLHPREAAIGRTLSTPQDSPARRRPDRQIPPELDELCFTALADEPSERPTARELADRIQAYLDGDRDLERRRQLAAQQLAAARDALANPDTADAHVVALRQAARAVALDPESTEATQLVSSLLLEPPKSIPTDLEAALEHHEVQINKDRSRRATWAYLSVLVLTPLIPFVEIKNWVVLGAFLGCVLLCAATSWHHARTGRPSIPVVLVVNLAFAILFSRLVSPFVLTPLMICCVLAAIVTIPWLNDRTWAIVGWAASAVMLPIVLEWLGVLPRTWSIANGAMVIVSDIVRSHGRVEEGLLAFANTFFTVVVALLALGLSRRRRMIGRMLYIHAWHLRQLVPSAKRWQTQPR
ncbi:MAG TPA: serine/threonine-protein kinase [Kofleriaceae bacterium]|nr:serine/threonine-protein kinase [Kofleriaceae bacterium]